MVRGSTRVVAAVLSAAVLAGAGTTAAGAAAPERAAAAAAASKDLGGPHYDPFCQHLGYVRSQLTPSKEWACLHADGTTSPLDVQAACEFSFTQRPIAALEITAGVPFTWQCFAAQPGKVVLPEGAGEGGSSSPVAAAVHRALIPTGRGAKIAALVRRGRYASSFQAPGLGRLTLSWYYKPRHGKRKLVATVTTTFSRSGRHPVTIVLTAKGKRLLAHAARLAISGRGAYVANASNPVGSSAAFTLRR